MSLLEIILIALAGVAGGLINALAGGGTLITFPMLTFVGIPPVSANVTNTVSLLPGYLGATFAQLKDLQGQARRAWLLIPASAVGGLLGGILLLRTSEELFSFLVPYLILLASALLAISEPVRGWLIKRTAGSQTSNAPESDLAQSSASEKSSGTVLGETWTIIPVGLAAIYGGYFGAGLSVIVLAVLGLLIDDSLTRLNALKQFIAFTVNVSAAVFFVFSGQVVWLAAAIMAVGALIGGALGGRLASRVKPSVLRRIVVVIGVIVSIIYFVR